MAPEEDGIIAIASGPAAKAQELASDLVAEVAPLVYAAGGWQGVSGMSATLLFRALAIQEGYQTSDLIGGIASALANTFAAMTPNELRSFLVRVEQEASEQFRAKTENLRVMETSGEA